MRCLEVFQAGASLVQDYNLVVVRLSALDWMSSSVFRNAEVGAIIWKQAIQLSDRCQWDHVPAEGQVRARCGL